MNYYNENDPRAAAWLRQLIKRQAIPNGYVDERSIQHVKASDLAGYTQHHFFAGIGGWAYALRLAGIADDVSIWTGSCPCQPLSSAGERKGEMDERHLWPDFYRLIAECRPATIFGEQVASTDGLEWLDGVSLDLEELDYAFAAADLPAACVGSPHERQRFFWVAYTHLSCKHRWPPGGQQPIRDVRDGCDEAVGDSPGTGPQEQWREYRPRGKGCRGLVGFAMQVGVPQWNGPTIGVRCSDGSRRVSSQSGAFPLAHGLPARMGRLRGYGNAIVPQVAAKFIEAFIEANQLTTPGHHHAT
jgi:DNA (cytosine-5)-methyltransferase 1